jgi:hypothetical protein
MSKKDLDLLVEQYFNTAKAPALNLEMLVEMIEETIGDSYPDIAAASDPAGFDQNINPEMIATHVPVGMEGDRATIERVVAEIMGEPDVAMVDSVMLHFSNPQGLGDKGSPQMAMNEGRLTPEQWSAIYRQLLLVGVDSDMMEAIRLLADSGMDGDELKALLSQQTMQTARGMERMNEEQTAGQKFVLSLPKYTPTEAWGNPEHMDREQVNNIFKVVRGGTSIAGRIQYLNEFLDPAKAKRRTSPRVIINTMIIIESLKAAMNHFNESSAGFVFEAFMAALTGGHQEAGRVKGTLPIEDFVAFSQYGGKNIPVSLKLLGKSTGVKGSFTNLVDFLFVRGEPAIKYLVAYKTKEESGAVGALEIWEFDITRENLPEFIAGGSKKTRMLLGDVSLDELNAAIQSGDRAQIAAIITQAPGYTKRGMLHKSIADAARDGDIPPDVPAEEEEPMELSESLTFYQREKILMEEERVLAEGRADDPSQWEVSFKMIQNLGGTINLQGHGSLDFTASRFDAIAEIYAKTLEGRVANLLDGVQNLTTNIGEYFSSRQRSTAITHGQEAMSDAEVVKQSLEEDISSDSE